MRHHQANRQAGSTSGRTRSPIQYRDLPAAFGQAARHGTARQAGTDDGGLAWNRSRCRRRTPTRRKTQAAGSQLGGRFPAARAQLRQPVFRERGIGAIQLQQRTVPSQRTQTGGQAFTLGAIGLQQQAGGQADMGKVSAGFTQQLPGIADGQMQVQPARQQRQPMPAR